MAVRPFLCCLLFAIAPAAEAASDPREFVVTGTVLASPARPLPGARVEMAPVLPSYSAAAGELGGENPRSIAIGETGADGCFALRAPNAGTFTVSVRLAGWAPMRFGSFVLTRSRELPPLTLQAATDSTIKVLSADGQSIAGAWVAVVPPVPVGKSSGPEPPWKLEPAVARTSPGGTAVLPLPPDARAEVEVFVPGLAAAWRLVPNGGSVRLPPQARLNAVLLVTRADGAPADGVRLRLGGHGWPVGVTDSSGRLPLVLASGSAPRGQLLTWDGLPHGVRLRARGADPIQIRLQPTPVARGRVLDSVTGRGVAGGLVTPATDPGNSMTTDDQGLFALPGSAAEGWAFEVHAPGYLPRRLAVSARELTRGRLPSIALEPAARVAGRVLGPGGQPLSGVAIEAIAETALATRPFSPAEPVSDRAASGRDGAFELVGLRAASRYELRARKAGYLPAVLLATTALPRGRAPAVEMRLDPAKAAVGRIVDLDERSLEGALVALRPSRREGRRAAETQAEAPLAADDPAATRSDRQGRFRVAQCPAAEVDLEVRLDGYAPARRVGFRVGPGKAPLDLGTIALRPGVKLAGRVVNDQGRPVGGAEVFLVDRLPPGEFLDGVGGGREPDATSGADGGFSVGELPAGVAQQLVARAAGFLPAAVRGVRPPTATPLLVRLETGFRLAGLVVDEQSQPVPRAQVELTSQKGLEEDPYHRPIGRRVTREAVSDADGRFQIAAVPAGPAVLTASARGFVSPGEIELELPQRDPSRPLVVRLRSGAVLWGRVSTTSGEGVAGARVVAGDAAAASDAEGSYRLSGLAEGEQRVEVQHPSYRRLARTVQIDAGENRLDIELPAGVSVDGRVVDAGRDPVAGAEVRLRSEGPGGRFDYRSRSDADGQFRLEPVAAGLYRLEATAPDRSTGELPQAVAVDKEPIAGLDVVLERGAVLSGRVLGATPDELAFVRVEARAADGQTREARLEAAGTYRLRSLAPGDWLMRATLWQGQKEARARVVVGPTDRELVRDLEFGRKLTLSGVVLFDEQPLANATLTVRSQRFALERTVLTSFEGAFRLEDLEPDVYWLGINQPEQFITHNQFIELTEDRDVAIQIAAAAVSGTVRNAQSSEGIAAALIRLRPTQGPEFLIEDGSQEDGSFHLLRVPPALYHLQASASGFVGSEQTVEVAAGKGVSGLDIRLQPTHGGLLQVTLADGRVPQLVHLLATDAAGVPVIAETRTPDASGRVQLATLPAGSWQLLVSAPAAATATRAIVVPGELVSVTLPLAGRLHVSVPALAATDLLATVTLLAPNQTTLWSLGLGGKLQGSWPMTAGRATVEEVPAGAWLLHVESSDGRVWSGSVVMTGGGDAAVNLD